MKKIKPVPDMECRRGYLLFYAMGTLALLSLVGLVAITGATFESRSAMHQVREMQALHHAEAGAEVVKNEVELQLVSGLTMEEALDGLAVTAPAGIEFDDIDSFRVIVPNRIFEFTSVGRSGDAEVRLAVQFRRRELLEAGIYGTRIISSQPNLNIYGYDSREISNPEPTDSNGGALVGSSDLVDFDNNFYLDGAVVLGTDADGEISECLGCWGLDTLEVGYIEPDPMGATGGQLSQTLTQVKASNNNASNPAIQGTMFKTIPNQKVTFTAGDYYLTGMDTAPNTEVVIDATDGPVRFFVEGAIYFAPNNGLPLNDPFDFQIYAFGTDPVRIQPKGDLSSFVYAPNADVELWPNGKMKGGFWGKKVHFQPGGNFYVDTSLQDRILSNELETHAKYEHRSK